MGTFARVSKRISLGAGAVVLSVVAAVGCGGGGVDGGYSAQERTQFVDDCATSGVAESTCRCFYDTMAERLPYHRFRALDEAMKGGSKRIPDDVAGMAARCAGAAAARLRAR